MPHADPEARRAYHREYGRKWDAAHREQRCAYFRTRYASDAAFREHHLENARKWRALKAMTPEQRERELHRRQQARWAKKNPDSIAEAQRKWREKQDPELFRQYDRDRYALDPEKKKARSRAYYAANKDRINAKRRADRRG